MRDSTTASLPIRVRLPQWVAGGPGTSGRPAGTNGAGPAGSARAWLLLAALIVGATLVNGFTAVADDPHAAPWKPWVREVSSTAMLGLLAWIPASLALWSASKAKARSPSTRLLAFAVHPAGAWLFSALHVLGMLALRRGAYAAAGAVYHFGPIGERFLYELRKDLLTYAIFAAVFALTAPRKPAGAGPAAGRFDIRDGARLIRTPPGDILAAVSAGNYVEFILADGRRPLARATLAAVEAELSAFGFVRTHRRWIVNPDRVTGLRRQGAADWKIELEGAQAPLSRRYREALARLRAPGLP